MAAWKDIMTLRNGLITALQAMGMDLALQGLSKRNKSKIMEFDLSLQVLKMGEWFKMIHRM